MKKILLVIIALFVSLLLSSITLAYTTVHATQSVKVKLLSTNDIYLRYLGIAVNRHLGDNWWTTREYTCNYLITPSDVRKEFICQFTGTFNFAEASVSSDGSYTWRIEVTYPDGRVFECSSIDRRLRCPHRGIPTTTTTTLGQPDLIIEDIWNVGTTIYYRIKNQGTVAAGTTTSKLWVDGVAVAIDWVGSLGAGASSNEHFAYTWSCSGFIDTLTVCADVDNVVSERDESNNCRKKILSCPTTTTTTTIPYCFLEIFVKDQSGNPLDAFIYIDGNYETYDSYFKKRVSVGTHTVSASRPGYYSDSKTVSCVASETKRVVLVLTKIPVCSPGEIRNRECVSSNQVRYEKCEDGSWKIVIENCPSGTFCQSGKCVPSCIRYTPSISVYPFSQSARAGEQVSYTITITNNNRPACGYSSFYLSSQVPTGWSGFFDKPVLTIYPGTSATTTLKVTSKPSAALGTYFIYITVTGDGLSNFAQVIYHVLSPACAVGWTEIYRCLGNWRQRAFQNADCSLTWHNVEDCSLTGRICSEGRCIRTQFCTPQYLPQYKCLGNQRQQLYLNVNCEESWVTIETCVHGCSDGKCLTPPAKGTPLVSVEPEYEVERCKLNEISFDVINVGLARDTFNISYTGTAAKWISSIPSITLESQERKTIKAYAQVPCDAEAKSYGLTVIGSNSKPSYGYSSLKVIVPFDITAWLVAATPWIIAIIIGLVLLVVIIYLLFFVTRYRSDRRNRAEEFIRTLTTSEKN